MSIQEMKNRFFEMIVLNNKNKEKKRKVLFLNF